MGLRSISHHFWHTFTIRTIQRWSLTYLKTWRTTFFTHNCPWTTIVIYHGHVSSFTEDSPLFEGLPSRGQDLHYCFITVYNHFDNCVGPGHIPYTVFKWFSKSHIPLGVDLTQAFHIQTVLYKNGFCNVSVFLSVMDRMGSLEGRA